MGAEIFASEKGVVKNRVGRGPLTLWQGGGRGGDFLLFASSGVSGFLLGYFSEIGFVRSYLQLQRAKRIAAVFSLYK